MIDVTLLFDKTPGGMKAFLTCLAELRRLDWTFLVTDQGAQMAVKI